MRLAVVYKDSFNIHNNTFVDLAFEVVNYARTHKSEGVEALLVREEFLADYLGKTKFDAIFCIQQAGMRERAKIKELGIKIIVSWDDVHWWDDKTLQNRLTLFDYADVLLLPYYHHFLEIPEYQHLHHKAKHFPWFAPLSCFKYRERWVDRSDNILMSGRCSDQYPFRQTLRNYALENKDELDLLDHPSYKKLKHNFVNESYHALLNKYKSAIVTTAKVPINYLVLKYFEIPACGCLAFMQPHPELKDMGFVPYENYIPITGRNYTSQLNLKRWDVRKVSMAGKRLIRENHTSKNRAKQFFQILGEL